MKYFDHWLQIEKLAISLYDASASRNCDRLKVMIISYLHATVTSRGSASMSKWTASTSCNQANKYPACQCHAEPARWDSQLHKQEDPQNSEIQRHKLIKGNLTMDITRTGVTGVFETVLYIPLCINYYAENH